MIIIIPAEDGGYDYPIVAQIDGNDIVAIDELVRLALEEVLLLNPEDRCINDVQDALQARGFTFPNWSPSQWAWS